jgi:hypothetical protein
MKNLESLSNEKFKVSESELDQVRGGLNPAGGGTTETCITSTYYYTAPSFDMDKKDTDMCVYFDFTL